MSARRQARRDSARPAGELVNGVPVPPELRQPEHTVWRSSAAYVAYCGGHDYALFVSERYGVPASPANRRHHAARMFAQKAGLLARTGGVDFHELRRLGLLS